MKILLVQDILRSGGTERQTVLLANAFAAAGHRSVLLTFRPGGKLADTVDGAVARIVLQPFDLGLDWFAPRLSRAARRAAPDIVLCMGRMANCHAGALQAALDPRHPAAVVATMRTGKRLPWLFRRSLHRVSHIIANSRDARDTLVRTHGVPGEKITVIHNALIFPPEPAPDRNTTLRAAHGATGPTIVMLCVAMFRPEKNQRELIDIVAGLSASADWQLWLAGEGPARADCERQVVRLGLEQRVKFIGFHADPTALYAAADLAVHASWSEAHSNFLIEAQAHGLPAVAFDAQGIRECFLPDETGWVIPRNDAAAFRAALERLMNLPPPSRAAIASSAQAFARTTFDPARQVAAHLDLFRRLLK